MNAFKTFIKLILNTATFIGLFLVEDCIGRVFLDSSLSLIRCVFRTGPFKPYQPAADGPRSQATVKNQSIICTFRLKILDKTFPVVQTETSRKKEK